MIQWKRDSKVAKQSPKYVNEIKFGFIKEVNFTIDQ